MIDGENARKVPTLKSGPSLKETIYFNELALQRAGDH